MKGALVGGLLSGCLIGWISVGTQMKMAQGVIRFPQKIVSVAGCNANWVAEYLSLTLIPENVPKIQPPFFLYRLSYMYYTLVGAATAILVGLVVSFLTGGNGGKCVHEDLLSPVIYRFLRRKDGGASVTNSNGIVLESIKDPK